MSIDIDPRAHLPPDERHDELDVTSMHQQVMREHDEPRDGLEPVPMWFTFLAGLLFFAGGYYLSNFNGGFRGEVFDEFNRGGKIAIAKEEPPLAPEQAVALGRQVYTTNCQQCHQANGQGLPGQFPPLAGSDWVVGERASAARLSRILIHGLTGPVTVKSTVANSGTYNGNMPAWGKPAGPLSDRQIAAVLTFIRNEWGNKADPVTKEQVQTVHKAVGTHGPFTEAELLAITEEVPAGTPAPPGGATPTRPAK